VRLRLEEDHVGVWPDRNGHEKEAAGTAGGDRGGERSGERGGGPGGDREAER
jgi:hypothetical protein